MVPIYSVVIPHYDDCARLIRCLDALMPQIGQDGEVIVADNGTPGGLPDAVTDRPRVAVVAEPVKGAGPARNAGVRAARGRWILFVDADCVPAPDWVRAALSAARPNAITGGPVGLFDETPGPRSGAEAFETVFAFRMRSYFEDEGFLGTGNLVTARAVFDRVGGFRAGVSEDKEWTRRAAGAGVELRFDDTMRVDHPTRADWAALSGKWRRLTSETWLTERGTAGTRRRWALKAAAMPLSAAAHSAEVLRHPALSPAEKARALATLHRLRWARMGWMAAAPFTAVPPEEPEAVDGPLSGDAPVALHLPSKDTGTGVGFREAS